MRGSSKPFLLCCAPLVAALSVFSFLAPSESPEKAVEIFSRQFLAGDAAGIMKTIHPDIVSGKEISLKRVESFVRRFGKGVRAMKKFQINRKLASEDGKTRRFEATLVFDAPKLGKHYPEPAELYLTFLWVLEKKRWRLERPISMYYGVTSSASYPTSEQDELAMRYEAAMTILNGLKLVDEKDAKYSGRLRSGIAISKYKELEKRYPKEKTEKGIDPNSWGVTEFLKAAGMTKGGFLSSYYGDFRNINGEKRTPMPWDMFQDYASAAAQRAKTYLNRGDIKNAELTYRRIISFGRQALIEPGGIQFAIWGLRFQRDAAKELISALPSSRDADKKELQAFEALLSRRIDLMQTALRSIDDMADYRSLKAAIIAAQSESVSNFRQWAINTLAILAYKGAPADHDTIKGVGALVFVANPAMRKTARNALKDLAGHRSQKVRSFIKHQEEWVKAHKVYGSVSLLPRGKASGS